MARAASRMRVISACAVGSAVRARAVPATATDARHLHSRRTPSMALRRAPSGGARRSRATRIQRASAYLPRLSVKHIAHRRFTIGGGQKLTIGTPAPAVKRQTLTFSARFCDTSRHARNRPHARAPLRFCVHRALPALHRRGERGHFRPGVATVARFISGRRCSCSPSNRTRPARVPPSVSNSRPRA
jgi:hypothetical protein